MSTLSAVVQVLDGRSGQPAEAPQPSFRLDGKPVRPLPKPDAFYAFVDLPAGRYTLEISCSGYLSQQLPLEVPMRLSPERSLADAIMVCRLEPGPLYPYEPRTTLIRGQVLDAHSRLPLAQVHISAQHRDARQRMRQQHTASSGPTLEPARRAGRYHDHYHGRYALALAGRLPIRTEAVLQFSLPGYASCERKLQVQAGVTQFLDVELCAQEASSACAGPAAGPPGPAHTATRTR